jgi:hypothetical protein
VVDAFQFLVLWTTALGLVAALPLTTVLLYAALRNGQPPREGRARELRRLLLEEEVYGGERCVDCRERVDPEWVRCPYCTAQLRERCDDCGSLLKLHWAACPDCAGASVLRELPEPQVAHAKAA